jgi:LPS-assembly protein
VPALVLALGAATSAYAADQCPDARAAEALSFSSSLPTSDEEVHLDVEKNIEAVPDGEWQLNGEVTIRQGVRQLRTRDATYNPKTQQFRAEQNVEFSDPELRVTGAGADFDPTGGVTFTGAQFELPAVGARGGAERINATADGRIELDDVRYTTCPLGREDWVLRASDIDVDQRAGLGIGRGVRLDFKGVPILYAPFISFPVGNERKSGFLFPAPINSSRNGTGLAVPWYWNIAPNYDATFTPTYYSRRGAKLDTEFRYLNAFGSGNINAQYLPHDQEAGTSRSLLRFSDQSDLGRRLRLNLDAANASDRRWFEDFGFGQEGTSITYLNRSAELTYYDEHWLAVARMQNFQVIDDFDPATGFGVTEEERPYTLLPQISVRAAFPNQAFGLTYGLDFELSNFARKDTYTGMRLDVAPEIRMPLRGAGVYLEPAARWRYTAYELDNVAPGQKESPHRSAGIYSLDGGMIFERLSGSKSQRLQTLEPRFMYLYVPYRDQSDLPIFDTDAADLNTVQLFRTNRFIGADRLSDANQLSVGITSRLLDADTGQQFIAATIGQAYYFHRPRVTLPNQPLDDTESSDIIAELHVTAFRNWNVRMGVQWDPGDTRSEKGDVRFQYKPAHDRVMNLGYRFRRGSVEQVDGSVAWPVNERWSAYGRAVYSLEEETSVEQFAGLEYRSCCWRLRLVGRRAVTNREGDMHTDILLQFELNGLSSVGDADAFLEGAIQGYSFRPPESP